MKRISTPIAFTRILTVCFTLASVSIAFAQSDISEDSQRHKACSERTLFGDYGTKIDGALLPPNGPSVPLRTLVLFHFEGNGNLILRDYVVLNGKPQSDGFRGPSSGTYIVDSDCTGSASLVSPPLTFHFIVVKDGKEFSWLSMETRSAVSVRRYIDSGTFGTCSIYKAINSAFQDALHQI